MPPVAIDWPTALAWRMRRQLLDPVGTDPAASVVARLGAISAFPEPGAELAIRVRQARSRPGQVAEALASGSLIKTFAFRGAMHLLAPETGGAYLALRASSRMWELPSWRSYYGLAPSDWPELRAAVREALADGPLTRHQLAAAVTRTPRFRALGPAFTSPSRTFLKPFAWLGDLCIAPSRDGEWMVQRLDANPRWPGLPDIDAAGASAIEAYLRAYGPANVDHIHYWLGLGLGAKRKRLAGWIAGFGDRLTPITIAGEPHLVLTDDVGDLLGTRPTTAMRLLPAYDQWVLGPGTDDPHVVPSARRSLVSRGANPVVASGVVAGTWSQEAERLVVSWFTEAGIPPEAALGEAADRLAPLLDPPITGSLSLTLV